MSSDARISSVTSSGVAPQVPDWLLFFALLPLLSAGLLTMNSFVGENSFFVKQLAWAVIAIAVFFAFSLVDVRFLRRSEIILALFLGVSVLLASLFIIGSVFKGAQSWINFGWFTLQPSERSGRRAKNKSQSGTCGATPEEVTEEMRASEDIGENTITAGVLWDRSRYEQKSGEMVAAR